MARLIIWITLIGFLVVNGCIMYVPAHRRGIPPGHGGTPPGHGGVPPGQAKKTDPPSIRVVGIPRYILVPGTHVMVMAEIEADIFLVNGFYYYHRERSWFVAEHYNGPWRAISSRRLPPGLKGKSPGRLKAKAMKYKRRGKKKS